MREGGRSGRLVVVVFSDGSGFSRAEDLRLENDAGDRLVKSVGVAIWAEERFFQDNTSAPLADRVVGRMGEDLGCGGSSRG